MPAWIVEGFINAVTVLKLTFLLGKFCDWLEDAFIRKDSP